MLANKKTVMAEKKMNCILFFLKKNLLPLFLLINISIMSHNVYYYWFGRTQYIPRFGGNLQECGDFTWRVSDC